MKQLTPNVEAIRARGLRIIRGRVPMEVRKELSAAVKSGQLGRLKRDGLLPEVFYHPDQLHTARERRKVEAEYAIECIKRVVE